jgi:hypothetical protein
MKELIVAIDLELNQPSRRVRRRELLPETTCKEHLQVREE